MSQLNNPALTSVPQGKVLFSTKGGGNTVFVNAPNGTYVAVIVDVHDPVYVEAKGQFKAHHETRIILQLNKKVEQDALVAAYVKAGKIPDSEALQQIGKRYVVASTFNCSLNEKSSLRKFIEGGLNVQLGEVEWGIAELRAFLLGKNMMVSVVNAPGKADPTKIYDKITGQVPVPEGFPLLEVADGYIQKHLRNAAPAAPVAATVQAAPVVPMSVPAAAPVPAAPGFAQAAVAAAIAAAQAQADAQFKTDAAAALLV